MRLMAYCINAFFLIVVAANSSLAADPVSIIGVYQSTGTGMGVAIVSTADPEAKAAVFAVDVVQLDQSSVRLNAFFGPEQWQQFEQIWLKARRTAPPREGFGTEIGHYYDRVGKTAITVTVSKDGSITFAIVGEPKGKLVAGLLEIELKDFGKFDATVVVRSVAEYLQPAARRSGAQVPHFLPTLRNVREHRPLHTVASVAARTADLPKAQSAAKAPRSDRAKALIYNNDSQISAE
jgi:hypothetical protein